MAANGPPAATTAFKFVSDHITAPMS
jgi:hypothetical protein